MTARVDAPAAARGESGRKSWFQRHRLLGMLAVYAVLAGLLLVLDLIFSNVRKSSADFALYERRAPIGHVHKPGFSGYYGTRFLDEFKNRIAFNNLGFRNAVPFDSAHTAGKRVLFAVGDSVTAALEVPLEDAYPTVLGRTLGEPYAVYNAGVRAYDTHQVIAQYLVVLRPLKPWGVVYLICPNDLNNNVDFPAQSEYVRYFGKGVFNENLGLEYRPPARSRLTMADRLRLLFKTNLNFTYTVAKRASDIRGAMRGRAGAGSGAERLYGTEPNLRKMELLLRYFETLTAHDGVALFIAFAPACTGAPDRADEDDAVLAYRALRDFCETRLTHAAFIPTVDMFLDAYRADPDRPRCTFRHDPHLNAFGNRELGAMIGEAIRAHRHE